MTVIKDSVRQSFLKLEKVMKRITPLEFSERILPSETHFSFLTFVTLRLQRCAESYQGCGHALEQK